METGRRLAGWGWSGVLVATLTAVVLGVLWLGGVSAYTPAGRTHCGPAIQEINNLFTDFTTQRCHLARQDRLWLGFQVVGGMLVAGAAVLAAQRTALRRR